MWNGSTSQPHTSLEVTFLAPLVVSSCSCFASSPILVPDYFLSSSSLAPPHPHSPPKSVRLMPSRPPSSSTRPSTIRLFSYITSLPTEVNHSITCSWLGIITTPTSTASCPSCENSLNSNVPTPFAGSGSNPYALGRSRSGASVVASFLFHCNRPLLTCHIDGPEEDRQSDLRYVCSF